MLQGWDEIDPHDLTASQLGQAIGNGWPLPVVARILVELNRSMGWSQNVAYP